MRRLIFSRAKCFVGFLACSLFGCAAVYKVPENSPKAYLRISATEETFNPMAPVMFESLSHSDCKKSKKTLLGIINNMDALSSIAYIKNTDIGIPGGEAIPLKRKHEFEIEANKEFIISAKRPFNGPSMQVGVYVSVPDCIVANSFVPDAGGQYEALYSFNYNSCSMRLIKINKNISNGEVTKSPVKVDKLNCGI